jgi:hypothetical protein
MQPIPPTHEIQSLPIQLLWLMGYAVYFSLILIFSHRNQKLHEAKKIQAEIDEEENLLTHGRSAPLHSQSMTAAAPKIVRADRDRDVIDAAPEFFS